MDSPSRHDHIQRFVLRAVVLSLAVLFVAAASSQAANAAASAMLWSAPEQINPANPAPSANASLGLNAVSCASSSLCVAVEGAGSILTSTDPLEDPSSWATPYSDPNEYLTAVSCPSTLLCEAVARGGDLVTSTDPTDESSTWTASTPGPDLNGTIQQDDAISCAPNTTTCVFGGLDGLATLGRTGWQAVTFPGILITGLSCPSLSLCVATFSQSDAFEDDPSGVITTTNPTGGQSAWTMTYLPAVGLAGLSCPTVSLCVAVSDDYLEGIVTSTNPTGGASAWVVDPGNLLFTTYGISCASSALCVATGSQNATFGDEDTYDSTNPTGGLAAWNTSVIEPGNITVNQVVTSVSCLPETPTCVAVDRKNVYVGSSVSAHALTVALAGTGSGRVTASPGILCPGSCSNLLASGTTVTLDATAYPGGFFAGWSGPCANTAAPACVVTMSADEAITATIDSDHPSCTITPRTSTVLLTKRGRRRRVSLDTLPVLVTCDQSVKLALHATITATLHEQTKHHKLRTRKITLAPRHVSAKGGVATTIELKLPPRAIADLERRQHESMAITVRVRGAHGSSSASVTVPAIRVRRA